MRQAEHLESNIFQSVKQLETTTVLQHTLGLTLTKRGNSYAARCPFPGHEDKRPSFIIYPGNKGAWCFACQRGGDNVAIISQILDVKPIEAARLIANEFGLQADCPLSTAERQLLQEQAAQRTREREAVRAFQRKINDAVRALGLLVRTTEQVLAAGGYSAHVELADWLTGHDYRKFLLQVLQDKNYKIQLQALSDPEVIRWII
ncbi:MAG: CHC2 zinc finger domain-containing protein [Firmicutes bacterium]|nr:CHC2 zinc finger domain-containing protein [Bacillota bacterium]